jgi:hypothetical protein
VNKRQFSIQFFGVANINGIDTQSHILRENEWKKQQQQKPHHQTWLNNACHVDVRWIRKTETEYQIMDSRRSVFYLFIYFIFNFFFKLNWQSELIRWCTSCFCASNKSSLSFWNVCVYCLLLKYGLRVFT